MIQTLIMNTMILALFILAYHPMMLNILVVLQSMTIILMLFSNMESSWLSFMFFLIFLGGLLIIFSYLSALVPNELMNPSMMKLMITFLMLLIMNEKFFFSWTENSLKEIKSFSMNFSFSLIPFMIIYLLMGLCTIMFFSNFMKTPLKQEMS